MHRHHALRARPALAGLALAFALSACGDRGAPLDVVPAPTAPADPLLLASVTCTATPATGALRCGAGALPSDARGYVVVGGQDQYVHVGSSNAAYNAGTHVFSFDVTVQNLIPQAMGTTDGSTPDGSGVRLVFHSGPNVTSGSGSVSVANATGTGAFTGANQPYFAYTGAELGGDGILSQNETSSAKSWQLNADPGISFSFQLYVVAEVRFPSGYVDLSPPADTLVAGGAQALTATVRSAVGNPIPGQTVTWGTSDGAVATVDAAGTVTGVGPGSAVITATSGARSGTAAIAVCPSLAVGGVYLATAGSFCIGTGAAAAEYTVSPVNLSVSDLAYSVTGSGVVPVTGPPSPNRLPGSGGLAVGRGPVPDEAFHARLRQREVDMAGAMRQALVRGPGGGARRNIVPGVPSVGTVMNLNVNLGFCSPTTIRASTVRSVGTHVILMEDNSNPAGGFTTAQYDSVAADFDALVYPAVAGNFGAPFDIDANGGRVIALYTAAVNDMTPAGSGAYIGGFFYSRDLYSTTSCPGSNQGETFYMLAPDPGGAHGNVRSVSFVKGVTVGTLGHELQHLINASRRTYGAGGPYELEQVWLNEGLSHIAEEEVYYASSLHGPGENISLSTITASQAQIDLFFKYAEANFGRMRQFLLRPDTSGPFKNADNLAIRGATWSFLRYAADRVSGPGNPESNLWSGLAFSPDTGLTNLANRLGTDPKPWFRDWAAAMYLDDSGTSPAATWTQPSWNFRSIYGGLNYGSGVGYPLAVRSAASGVAQAFTVSQGGGTGYVRMGVAASAFAGVTSTPPGAALAVVVMRTK